MDRFTPQAGLIPAERLQGLAVTVIGVGAIGRQVSLQLAAIGVESLQLIDFDHVDATNITTQGYAAADLGRPKVAALADAVLAIDSEIHLTTLRDRFRKRYAVGSVVFCCVDKIATRAAIWKSLHNKLQFWCDGRMHGEVIRVLAADATLSEHRSRYAQTLFQQTEAHSGSCTTRSTIYAASIAAGLMTQQFSRWLRGMPIDQDLTLNLLASELIIA